MGRTGKALVLIGIAFVERMMGISEDRLSIEEGKNEEDDCGAPSLCDHSQRRRLCG